MGLPRGTFRRIDANNVHSQSVDSLYEIQEDSLQKDLLVLRPS